MYLSRFLYTVTHFSYGNTVSSLERGRGGQYSQDNAVLTVRRKVNENKTSIQMEIFLREVLAHILELHHDFSNKFVLMIIDFRKFTKLTETHFHLKSSLSIITHIPKFA